MNFSAAAQCSTVTTSNMHVASDHAPIMQAKRSKSQECANGEKAVVHVLILATF